VKVSTEKVSFREFKIRYSLDDLRNMLVDDNGVVLPEDTEFVLGETEEGVDVVATFMLPIDVASTALTEAELRVWKCLQSYKAGGTYEELRDHLAGEGYDVSKSAIQQHVKRLERKGYVEEIADAVSKAGGPPKKMWLAIGA